MPDQVTRLFKVDRGHFQQNVYYSTYSTVFDIAGKVAAGEKITTSYGKLAIYLAHVFWQGVPSPAGKKSVSSCPLLQVPFTRTTSTLVEHAKAANYDEQGKFQHRIVQRYLMDNDVLSFASEVPVWDDELHGHIDLIRVINGDMLEIADFKPKASSEKKAASQLYRYCHLLSKRTGIPLSNMRATYFDNQHAYTVTL